MSRVILTHFFAYFLMTNCTVRKIDYPYEYVLDKDDIYSSDVEASRFGHGDINDIYDGKRIEADTNDENEVSPKSFQLLTKSPKMWLPYLRKGPTYGPPGLRTDVVFRLREKLHGCTYKAPLVGDANYKLIGDPWPWPVISFQTKITPLTLPTPPLRTTRTFRDHFLTVKYNMFHRNTFSTTKYPTTSTDTFTPTKDIATVNNFMWKHNFLPTTSQIPWYLAYKTMIRTNAIFFPGIREYNTSKKTISTTVNNTKYVKSRINLFTLPIRAPNATAPTVQVLRVSPTRSLSYQFDDDEIGRGLELRQDYGEVEKTETATTTTTTTRTTRTYPYPKWICYECGRNETKFGSSFCHNVFETKNNRENAKRHGLHYKCNGHKSAVYQCFKRFLDIGEYNERGCRDFPPHRSGKTFVSKRLRALEEMLYDVRDGCIFSPHAALVPFSRTIQLYARFHVCVCNGTLCNKAIELSSQTWLIFSVAMMAFGTV